MATKESDRGGERVSLRLSDELYAQIERLATADRRTVASWIRLRIEDAVAGVSPSAPARADGLAIPRDLPAYVSVRVVGGELDYACKHQGHDSLEDAIACPKCRRLAAQIDRDRKAR
jgi:hypothetical protein